MRKLNPKEKKNGETEKGIWMWFIEKRKERKEGGREEKNKLLEHSHKSQSP